MSRVIINLKSSGEKDGPTLPARARSPGNGSFTRRNEMKQFAPTILSLILTMVVSSTAFAGHIAGGRTSGNIAGGRAAGNIAGGRATGNIAGGRAATYANPSSNPDVGILRYDPQSALSGTFNSFIRMLLESGALL